MPDRFPLHTAVQNYQVATAQRLLTWDIVDVNDVDMDGKTALHYSVHSFMIQFLIEHGADVFKRDLHGNGPLDSAIKDGNVRSVSILKNAIAAAKHQRLLDLALLLAPTGLCVLVIYNIYRATRLGKECAMRRFEAWKLLAAIKSHSSQVIQ